MQIAGPAQDASREWENASPPLDSALNSLKFYFTIF